VLRQFEQSTSGAHARDDVLAELARIEQEIVEVSVPPSYMEELYNLRLHMSWVRREVIDPSIKLGERDLPIAIRRHARAKRMTLRLAPDGSEVRITLPRWGRTAEAIEFARKRRDGSDRYLVDRATIEEWTRRLGARLLDPVKTTLVEELRAMTTWVLEKPHAEGGTVEF